jgi:hypothetical protein
MRFKMSRRLTFLSLASVSLSASLQSASCELSIVSIIRHCFNTSPAFVPTTTTKLFNSTPATSNCQADCAAHFDYGVGYSWQKYAINTTITAATLEKIIYPKYNATRTHLLPNDLPPGYTTPDRNEAGTVVTTITLNRGKLGPITTVL